MQFGIASVFEKLRGCSINALNTSTCICVIMKHHTPMYIHMYNMYMYTCMHTHADMYTNPLDKSNCK